MKLMKSWKLLLLLSVLIVALTAYATSQEEKEDNKAGEIDHSQHTFKIGVIPALTEGELEVATKKLEKVLDDALPHKVELEVYPDYNGVVEALNFGHIQMAYLGPSTYIIANHKSGAKAIVTQLIKGKPYYHSYIITHVDNPWNTLEEMLNDKKSVTFAFGDINSTSGSIIPGYALSQIGVFTDENTHQFKQVTYTGSHDATGLAIQNKHVTAGAIDSAYFDLLVEQGKLDGTKFKVLWKSEPLFQYPWTVAKDTDEETIKTIRETMIAIKDEDILKGFGATGFTEAKDEDYEAIRQVMKATGKLE